MNKKQTTTTETTDHKSGRDAGRAWVRDENWGAGPESIKCLQDACKTWNDWFGRTANATHAQSVYYAIFPEDRGNVREAEQFWEHWAEENDPSPQFVEGFVEGALEAWEETGTNR